MNTPWPRIPHPREEWKEFRIEDLFLCHHCKQWLPWFKFTKGKYLAIPEGSDSDTYEYMNDDKDRGGRMWACDYCIDFCTEQLILINTDKN